MKDQAKMEQGKDIDSVIYKLNLAMNISHLYRNPDLSLTQLAATLGVHYGSLSDMIYQYYGVGFRKYLNDLRVDKLISEIEQSKFEMTVAECMELAGFKSRVTFHNAFKSKVGMTLTAYYKSQDKLPKQKIWVFEVVG
jgi:AraC-like DNA-binding protein